MNAPGVWFWTGSGALQSILTIFWDPIIFKFSASNTKKNQKNLVKRGEAEKGGWVCFVSISCGNVTQMPISHTIHMTDEVQLHHPRYHW